MLYPILQMTSKFLASAALLVCAGCMPIFVYKPAVVEGVVVSADTGAPIAGARVSFVRHPDVTARTTDDGKFSIGDRDFAIMPILPDVGRPFPVTVRIECEGYDTLLLQMGSGKHVLDEPLRMSRL